MFGIGHGKYALATWRVLFMVCGGLTVAAGVAFIFVMPVDSTTAWFLNDREKELATRRLAIDRATRDRAHFDWKQAKEAFVDPRTWLFAFMALCITLPTPIVKVRILPINLLTIKLHVRLRRLSFMVTDNVFSGSSSRPWSSTVSATTDSRPCSSACPAAL